MLASQSPEQRGGRSDRGDSLSQLPHISTRIPYGYDSAHPFVPPSRMFYTSSPPPSIPPPLLLLILLLLLLPFLIFPLSLLLSHTFFLLTSVLRSSPGLFFVVFLMSSVLIFNVPLPLPPVSFAKQLDGWGIKSEIWLVHLEKGSAVKTNGIHFGRDESRKKGDKEEREAT